MTVVPRAGRVLIIGSLNIDIIATVDRHPAPGETVRGSALGRAYGGKGANQAVAAAAAGAVTTLVGRVGDDTDGGAYVARLEGRGIDVSGVRTEPGSPTGTALIVVDTDGENSIVVVPGANAAVSTGDVDGAFDADARRPQVVLLQLEVALDVVAHAVRAAAAAGVRVVLNTAPYADLPEDVLAAADPEVANEHEAAQLAALGVVPRSLVVTRGPRGASWTRDGTTVEVAAPRVEPVDTTGAGDAFCGALAAALAAGADQAVALTVAVAAGSAAVSRPGAQP